MSAAGYLRERSSDYGTLALWHAERAPMDAEHAEAARAFLIVGIVVREIADAMEEGDGE